LYPYLFNGLNLQETTHHPIQINSKRLAPFEVLDGGNVHMEDREYNASSHELITTKPYQPFSGDQGNDIEDVYQNMHSPFSSSSFFINITKSSCSSNPLIDIVHVSGFPHCFEYLPYIMVGVILHISFDSTNLSQVDGFLKYDSREACQYNEALQSTLMVMLGTHYFGLYSGIKNFINMKILSLSTLHMNSMHGSHSIC
jgi:hypothetical protein